MNGHHQLVVVRPVVVQPVDGVIVPISQIILGQCWRVFGGRQGAGERAAAAAQHGLANKACGHQPALGGG